MKEILCYLGISTLINLFCVIVFDCDLTLIDKIKFFGWCEVILIVLFGIGLIFTIMIGDLNI